MAHFDLANLEEARKRLCGLDSHDKEIRRQGQANFESICPKDKYSDPYVVAVLIALAQQQRLFLDSQPEEPDPKGKRPEYLSGDQICASYKSRSFLVGHALPYAKSHYADACTTGSCFRHLQR